MTPLEFDSLNVEAYLGVEDTGRIRAALIRLENGDYHASRKDDDRHWLREFAAAALKGLLANPNTCETANDCAERYETTLSSVFAGMAFEYGESMLSEAKRREGSGQ